MADANDIRSRTASAALRDIPIWCKRVNSADLADNIAWLLQTITGDTIRIRKVSPGWIIERYTGSEWVIA